MMADTKQPSRILLPFIAFRLITVPVSIAAAERCSIAWKCLYVFGLRLMAWRVLKI